MSVLNSTCRLYIYNLVDHIISLDVRICENCSFFFNSISSGRQESLKSILNPVNIQLATLLNLEALKSWAKLPGPPEPMSHGDVVLRLLDSDGYSASPKTFEWAESTDTSYESLWYMCVKMASRGEVSHNVAARLRGRSSAGYVFSIRGPTVTNHRSQAMLTDSVEISSALAAYGMSGEFSMPFHIDASLPVDQRTSFSIICR